MAESGATTVAGNETGHVYRFSAQVCTTSPKTAAALSNAVTAKLDSTILDSQIHVVKDDAHPAAKK